MRFWAAAGFAGDPSPQPLSDQGTFDSQEESPTFLVDPKRTFITSFVAFDHFSFHRSTCGRAGGRFRGWCRPPHSGEEIGRRPSRRASRPSNPKSIAAQMSRSRQLLKRLDVLGCLEQAANREQNLIISFSLSSQHASSPCMKTVDVADHISFPVPGRAKVPVR